MPKHHHQTFDTNGKLLHEVVEEYEPTEPEPSPEERIATLESELADMRGRVAEVAASNAEVKAMQEAITGGKRP